MLKLMTHTAALVAVLLMWLAASYATANVVTLDFQSVVPNAGNGPAYLNSHGITLTNITPSGPSGVVDILNLHSLGDPGNDWINENVLLQNGGGAVPCSYTMNFSTPLESIGFTRITTPPDLSTEAQWSATAYAGATAVGAVGESLDSWGNSPALPFILTGDGITSLTISQNGFGFTGIGSVPLDNFVLTTVPEPSTLILLGAGGIGLISWTWQRGAQTRCGG
jgi:PEP-CTERM motif